MCVSIGVDDDEGRCGVKQLTQSKHDDPLSSDRPTYARSSLMNVRAGL